MYTEKEIEELYSHSKKYYANCFELQTKIVVMSQKMHDEAKEHAIYGIARRLSTLRECMKFFFDNLPPELNKEIEFPYLTQGNINLHAFLINCAGISDNIAWFLAYHIRLNESIDLEKYKFSIGLFHKDFSQHLTDALGKKVASFNAWHNHIISFRHPTAHRIPPYIIPYFEFANGKGRDYTPYYIQAFDKGQPVPLHAQVICDLGAVVELVEALVFDIQKSYA